MSLPQNDLFSVLLDKTVIVIDHLETQKFDTEMKLFIKKLAIQSRLTGKCNVVVSVSDIEMANEILQLNGLDKIRRAGTDDDFIWNDTEIEEFIELGCKQWNDKDKDSFRTLARLSRNPSFLHCVLVTYPKGLPTDKKILKESTEEYHSKCENFKKLVRKRAI